MLEEFLAQFSSAKHRFMLNDGVFSKIGGSEKRIAKGDPKNEIIFLAWQDKNGNERRDTLREADISAGGYNPATQTYEFFGTRRQPVNIRLTRGDEEFEVLEPQDKSGREARYAFPISMVEEFRRVWQLADWKQQFVVVGEVAHAITSSELSVPTGLPGNYLLVARCHEDGESKHVVVVTEQGVEAGRFNPERQVFEFSDRDGNPVAIQVRRGGAVIVPDILVSPYVEKPSQSVFVVIQEGGTSTELYVQQFDSQDSAHDYRVECWSSGAYRTSPIVEVPRSLADHPAFDDVVQELLKATQEFDGVEEEEA
ncbi:hypothetical protein AB4Y45_35775 [Paraburkholderia sp. EG287A]|uniref:hypothetical protein n=1 Tax=Paraburkholderia sp. EG287A TaxID=3237012 RepID=UPI0034D1E02D